MISNRFLLCATVAIVLATHAVSGSLTDTEEHRQLNKAYEHLHQSVTIILSPVCPQVFHGMAAAMEESMETMRKYVKARPTKRGTTKSLTKIKELMEHAKQAHNLAVFVTTHRMKALATGSFSSSIESEESAVSAEEITLIQCMKLAEQVDAFLLSHMNDIQKTIDGIKYPPETPVGHTEL